MIHWCEKLKPGAQRAVLEANETQEVVRVNPIQFTFTTSLLIRYGARSAQKKKGLLEWITGLQPRLRADYWITA